jgi:hypothetical protein
MWFREGDAVVLSCAPPDIHCESMHVVLGRHVGDDVSFESALHVGMGSCWHGRIHDLMMGRPPTVSMIDSLNMLFLHVGWRHMNWNAVQDTWIVRECPNIPNPMPVSCSSSSDEAGQSDTLQWLIWTSESLVMIMGLES